MELKTENYLEDASGTARRYEELSEPEKREFAERLLKKLEKYGGFCRPEGRTER